MKSNPTKALQRVGQAAERAASAIWTFGHAAEKLPKPLQIRWDARRQKAVVY